MCWSEGMWSGSIQNFRIEGVKETAWQLVTCSSYLGLQTPNSFHDGEFLVLTCETPLAIHSEASFPLDSWSSACAFQTLPVVFRENTQQQPGTCGSDSQNDG